MKDLNNEERQQIVSCLLSQILKLKELIKETPPEEALTLHSLQSRLKVVEDDLLQYVPGSMPIQEDTCQC